MAIRAFLYIGKGVFTNYWEGSYKMGGEASEVLPLRKRGGAKKCFAMLKGRRKTFPFKRGA